MSDRPGVDSPRDDPAFGPDPVGPESFAPPTPSRPRRWDVALVIAGGGAIGGGGRWLVNETVPTAPGGFPWSTLLENVTGCLLLAVLMVFLLDVWPPRRYTRPFLGVGVLGGYTTFSAYTADIRVLLEAGRAASALTYLFASVGAGLLAVIVGLQVTRRLTGVAPPRRREDRP